MLHTKAVKISIHYLGKHVLETLGAFVSHKELNTVLVQIFEGCKFRCFRG